MLTDICFHFVLILYAFATAKFKFLKASATQTLLKTLGMKIYPLELGTFSALFTQCRPISLLLGADTRGSVHSEIASTLSGAAWIRTICPEESTLFEVWR